MKSLFCPNWVCQILMIRECKMKNIIFIEGVSGVGKTTAVYVLNEQLSRLGYKVGYHIEGDAYSPLDLCWTAYLTKSEYENLLEHYSEYADEMSRNIVYQGEYYLVRYKIGLTGLYSDELNNELHKHEFCYNPTNVAPLSKFTEVFTNLWQCFADSDLTGYDYMIFDASLVSHMTSDLLRNYNASESEMLIHLQSLLKIIYPLNPIVFYLSSDNVRERLINARISRNQSVLTDEKIAFWEKRKQMDLSILPKLDVETHMMDISNDSWNTAINEIVKTVISLNDNSMQS